MTENRQQLYQTFMKRRTPYEVYYGGTTASATAMAYPAYGMAYNPNTITTTSSPCTANDALLAATLGGINT